MFRSREVAMIVVYFQLLMQLLCAQVYLLLSIISISYVNTYTTASRTITYHFSQALDHNKQQSNFHLRLFQYFVGADNLNKERRFSATIALNGIMKIVSKFLTTLKKLTGFVLYVKKQTNNNIIFYHISISILS